MRGEQPINLRDLLDEVRNKKNMYEGSKMLQQEGQRTLEYVSMRESDYLEALSRLQALPPPPVLPPRTALCKISGQLQEFNRIRCENEFDVDFYRNNTLPHVSDEQRLTGGVLATVAGSPALGAQLVSGDDKPGLSAADYITGIINNQPFRGWVGMTALKIGDEVEIVAGWQDDHYEVYAITYPAERIISVCPRCDFGHEAYGWLRVKYMIITILFFLIIAWLGLGMVREGNYLDALIDVIDMNNNNNSAMWAIGFFVSTGVSALIAIASYKSHAPTTCKLAEDIFSTLGWKDVEAINLVKTTTRRERNLKREGKWHSPKRKDKPLRPTSKYCGWFEYWYYY